MAVTGIGTIGAAPAGLGTIRLTMDLDGIDRVDVALGQWGEEISDWREFWTDYFAPKWYRDIESNFRREGASVGGWASLSTEYAKWKDRHYPGKTLLRRTDRLYDSVSVRGAPDSVFVPERGRLTVGTSVPYAPYHQRGGKRQKRRRFLFFFKNASFGVGRLLHRFALDRAVEAGLKTGTGGTPGTTGGRFL